MAVDGVVQSSGIGTHAPSEIVFVNRRGNPLTPRDARRILDERLARGEIDPTEYRTRREALEG